MTTIGTLIDKLTQSMRRVRMRCLFDVHIPGDCWIGKDVTISGNVSLGTNTIVEDGVILDGNIRIGAGCSVGRQAELRGNIVINDSCVIGSFSIISAAPNATIKVGADTFINSFNVLGASAALDIGSHCIFAAFVQITDATHGIDDISIATKHASTTASPIKIGDNVWLGSGVTVTMGSSIGNDAVVGAKSLVRTNLPERSVSFGIPAAVHRIRN